MSDSSLAVPTSTKPLATFGSINVAGYKGKLWCGPAALSIVTGRPIRECFDMLREVSGLKRIEGAWSWQIRESLDNWGYAWSHHKFSETTQPKLYKLQEAGFAQHSPVIVGLDDHFIVCYQDLCCDRFSIDPVPRLLFGHSGRKVLSYIRVRM